MAKWINVFSSSATDLLGYCSLRYLSTLKKPHQCIILPCSYLVYILMNITFLFSDVYIIMTWIIVFKVKVETSKLNRLSLLIIHLQLLSKWGTSYIIKKSLSSLLSINLLFLTHVIAILQISILRYDTPLPKCSYDSYVSYVGWKQYNYLT